VTAAAVPGRLYLIDTSAQARAHHPQVRTVLAGLIANGSAATCVTVDLDAGYSGRTHADLVAIAKRRRALYTVLPITEDIGDRACDVQLRMAARGHHRAAGIVDLLTAAIAEHHGAVIVHYDADFEHIAMTTGQPHIWVVPRGSVP
jgi:predicted nucleic acid-binding protein